MVEEGTTLYLRCKLVVVKVLADIFREYMQKTNISFETIYDAIISNEKFKKKLKPNEINKIQFLLVNGFNDFDITLMYKIARYPKFSLIVIEEPTHGWDSYPQPSDNAIGDNMERIRKCRNDIDHNPHSSLSEDEYDRAFNEYLDIGRRANAHLGKVDQLYEKRVIFFKTCTLDKKMKEEHEREINHLQLIVESRPNAYPHVKIFVDQQTQTAIDDIRNRDDQGSSSAKLTITGTDNPKEEADRLNHRRSEVSTQNIKLEKATDGSLILYLTINHDLFEMKSSKMEGELEEFIRITFDNGALKFIYSRECNIVLEIGQEYNIYEWCEGEDSEDESDLVLQLEVNNGIFKTPSSLSENIDDFIHNVATEINENPCTGGGKELTAHLSIIRSSETGEMYNRKEDLVADAVTDSDTDVEVKNFLSRIGLEKYFERFVTEQITMDHLLEMTDFDLKDIGVDMKGHRMTLLKEAKFRREKKIIANTTENKSLLDVLLKMGVQHLFKLFEREEIFLNALAVITDDDLKDIEVEIEDRKKIMQCIQSLEQFRVDSRSCFQNVELTSFLDSLKLVHLEERFTKEGVELQHLAEITDEDLQEIGISKKGNRILIIAKSRLLFKSTGDISEKRHKESSHKEYLERTDDDVSLFLKKIKLQKLIPIFHMEEITMDVLLKMTDDQLKTIGISLFGNRQQILNSIAEWKENTEIHEEEVYDEICLDDWSNFSLGKKEIENAERKKCQVPDNVSSSHQVKHLIQEFEKDDSNRPPPVPRRPHEVKKLEIKDVNLSPEKIRNANTSSVNLASAQSANSKTNRKSVLGEYSEITTAAGQVAMTFKKLAEFEKQAQIELPRIYNLLLSALETLPPNIKEDIEYELDINVKNTIEEAKEKLKSEFCPIVVTGETSAGKSSFVNLLLGVKILPQSVLACTSTVCRIHNSKEKKVVLTDAKNRVETLKITKEDNIEELLKSHLSIRSPTTAKPFESSSESDRNYNFVDIYWPIPVFGEDKVTIVDTPGFGPDNPELTKKVYKYLPEALAFIYILNTPNSGGVQSDRILRVQDAFAKYHIEEDVALFDPERAIFICNKWDQIHEDPEDVFKTVQALLKEKWIGFDPKKLFKLSVLKEMENFEEGKQITNYFDEILKTIEEMMPKTITEKYQRHFEWQKKVTEKMLLVQKLKMKNTLRTLQEKIEARDNLEAKLKEVKNELEIKKITVFCQADQEFDGMIKHLLMHLKQPETLSTICKSDLWTLPHGNDIKEIRQKIDKMIYMNINQELRMQIQKREWTKIKTFLDQVAKNHCFTLLEELDDPGYSNFSDHSVTLTKQARIGKHDHLKLNTSEIVFLAVASPILVPAAIAFGSIVGLVYLPYGASKLVQKKIHMQSELSKYHGDRQRFAKERAETIIQQMQLDNVRSGFGGIWKQIKNYLDKFFKYEMPYRIRQAEQRLKSIQIDIKEPLNIRPKYYKAQQEILIVYGEMIATSYGLFRYNHIETRGSPKSQNNVLMQQIVLKEDEVCPARRKCVKYNSGNEQFFRDIGEANLLRKLNGPYLAQVYGMELRKGNDLVELTTFSEHYEANLDYAIFFEPISRRKSYKYITDALEGLWFLHQNGIAHRRVRLEAILIKDDEAKISDGGIYEVTKPSGEIRDVPIMRAPESIKDEYFGIESDIFQVGLILWEAWYQKRAYFINGDNKCMFKTFEDLESSILNGERPKLTFKQPPRSIAMKIMDCWEDDLNKRPFAKDVRDVILVYMKDIH